MKNKEGEMLKIEEKAMYLAEKAFDVFKHGLWGDGMPTEKHESIFAAMKKILETEFLKELKETQKNDEMARLGEALMTTLEEKAEKLSQIAWEALPYQYGYKDSKEKIVSELKTVLAEELKTLERLPEDEPGIAY